MIRAIIFSFIIFFFLPAVPPVLAFAEENSSSLFSGRIFTEDKAFGGFWYVNPGDFHRYYISNDENGRKTLKNLAVSIASDDFEKTASTSFGLLKGRIVNKTKDLDRLFYIDKEGGFLTSLDDLASAMFLLGLKSSSTESCALKDVPIAKIAMDSLGMEQGREWQYNGWWGKVNNKYAPVMVEPKAKAKRVGAFSQRNRVKVIAVLESEGKAWYKIDGGMHAGAFVEAKFIEPIPQPIPENKTVILPKPVKEGEYWVDVNLTKFVLTLYKKNQAVFATYVSIGVDESPTLPGIYSVTHKYKKTRMHGAPPQATHYYDLKDVPWTMYYFDSYALHGAYWQDEFGGKRSSGCINLTIGDSGFIFGLMGPFGDAEKVRYSSKNPGSIVYNHY